MSENAKTNADVKTRWYKPVNRLGRITLVLAMVFSFFPFIYVFMKYGKFPPMETFFAGLAAVASSFVAGWIVEPIAYFPSMGTAGTYMGILAGSMGQMRVPAATVAKSVLEVEENTQEAEIVSTCGIAGSVFMNAIILGMTAIAGTAIVSALPDWIMNTLTAYVLPAMFGATTAMFTTKGKIPLTVSVLIISLVLNLLVKYGVVAIPAWMLMVGMVLVGVAMSRLMYKKGWIS